MNQLIFLESVVKMPVMSLPVRSTYLPVKDGGILISPGSCLSTEQLKGLESVTDIVAPNLFHCGGVLKAASVFPNAKIWGVSDSRKLKPEVPWTEELSVGTWDYNSVLQMIQVNGMPGANEAVFYHKESKSLIVADLCFNLVEAQGFGAWVILSLFGTYRKFGISRFLLKFVKDKDAFQKSIAEIMDLDFENIIVSHGANVVGGAKVKLRQALAERGFKHL